MKTRDAREEYYRQMKINRWLDMAQRGFFLLLTVVCFVMLCVLSYIYILT